MSLETLPRSNKQYFTQIGVAAISSKLPFRNNQIVNWWDNGMNLILVSSLDMNGILDITWINKRYSLTKLFAIVQGHPRLIKNDRTRYHTLPTSTLRAYFISRRQCHTLFAEETDENRIISSAKSCITNSSNFSLNSTEDRASLPELLSTRIWDANTHCVVLSIPEDSPITYKHNNHRDEINYLSNLNKPNSTTLSTNRINSFLGGRQALRRAFSLLDYKLACPILKDIHGAPVINPKSLKGSISHKDTLVVGLGSLSAKGNIGVDIERCHHKAAEQLQRRLLTNVERQSLGSLQSIGVSIEEEVLLRFSFKEAVYKALHPDVLRPIGFLEAEIYPHINGTAMVKLCLSDTSTSSKISNNSRIEATWMRVQEKYWLTAVRISA